MISNLEVIWQTGSVEPLNEKYKFFLEEFRTINKKIENIKLHKRIGLYIPAVYTEETSYDEN